jgi:hypothetical protein
VSLAELRRQLAALARSRHSRTVGIPSRGLPSDWRPYTVMNPESGLPFTEASAWNLLVQLLEEGHPVLETTLDHPPGARGFVLLVDLKGSTQTLYVKVQLGANCVIGRSFHYSYEPGLHGTPRGRRDD